MSRTLLVFVVSPRLDPYANSMAHCIKVHGINRIVLIGVEESPLPPMIKDFRVFVNEEIWLFIKGLAEGKYVTKSPPQEIPFEPADDIYKRLFDVFASSKVIKKVNYQELRKEMAKLREEYGSDVIVDITGTPKRLAADILASCLAAGIENVFTFELLVKPSGVDTLYHNLHHGQYEHVLLPSSAPLISNLSLFAVNQSKIELITVALALIASFLFVTAYLILRRWYGENNLLLILGMAFINILGGIFPLADIFSGTRFVRRLFRIS